MSTTNSGLGNIFQSAHNSPMNATDAAQLKQLEATKQESMEHTLFAAAQSLAMAKLKVFNSMAKSVNDQQ